MATPRILVGGGPLFDGSTLREGVAVRLAGTRIAGICPDTETGAADLVLDLDGDTARPGRAGGRRPPP